MFFIGLGIVWVVWGGFGEVLEALEARKQKSIFWILVWNLEINFSTVLRAYLFLSRF